MTRFISRWRWSWHAAGMLGVRGAVAALEGFGLGWVLFRFRYALERRLGIVERRAPARRWTDIQLPELLQDPALGDATAYWEYRCTTAPAFLFSWRDRERDAAVLLGIDGESREVLDAAHRLREGAWTWFGAIPVSTPVPPNWHRNVLTGESAPSDVHWSRLSDFAYGDVKAIWEPSRFSAAYLLARAYWRSGDEANAECFWSLVEDWRRHNQPGQGINWKCGQEASLRGMAWCFGLHGFMGSHASTPERVVMLAEMLAETAARVESNLEYALSQHNNHGVSEGVGLFTIGTLFPEFRDAERWSQRGREVLERLACELIYDDGAFSQHSVNYQRLMLHNYLWAIRIAELQGTPLSEELRCRVRRSADLLHSLQDAGSGQLPTYGANDGSLILPLSSRPATDYRSVLQAASAVLDGERRFGDGAWDEEAFWMAGREAVCAKVRVVDRTSLWAEVGGYYTLRRGNAFAFLRCSSFHHRPGHADQLHVDLWMRGTNVALDAGTFGYNSRESWAPEFEHTTSHNTITVDGRGQTEKVSRFLAYPWPTGRMRSTRVLASASPVASIEGESHAYRNLISPVTHRRAILALDHDTWLVVDALRSPGNHAYRLHWLLCDTEHEWDAEARRLRLALPSCLCEVLIGCGESTSDTSLVRADPASARGWRAPTYGTREPALSLALEFRAEGAWCWTVFSGGPIDVTRIGTELSIHGAGWATTVSIDPDSPRDLATVRDGLHVPTNRGDTGGVV